VSPHHVIHDARRAALIGALRERRRLRRLLNVGDEELDVLLLLAHAGPRPVREIAEFVGLSSIGAGAMLTRLADAGLTERFSDPDHPRARFVQLTSDGAEIVAAVMRIGDRSAEQALTAHDQGEISTAARVLDVLAGISPAGDASGDAVVAQRLKAASRAQEPPIWRR
jgi:DNA-binding MarR family transcriptional regulator